MRWPELATFNRESEEGLSATGRLYARSYLDIRFIIGALGLALPAALIALDWWFMTDSRQIRGSLSAYYHSPARDLFVAGLCVIGMLLMTYMIARPWTWDYILSLGAGAAVVVIAFFPTKRRGVGADDNPYCGLGPPEPSSCAPIQNKYGELNVQNVHGTAATTFVVLLAALCFVFALREYRLRKPMRLVRVGLYSSCAVVILGFGLWALFGDPMSLFGYTWGNTYVGEIGAFATFATAWLTASWDLWAVALGVPTFLSWIQRSGRLAWRKVVGA